MFDVFDLASLALAGFGMGMLVGASWAVRRRVRVTLDCRGGESVDLDGDARQVERLLRSL
jgi:preprotein translocase subunit SecF